MESITPPLTTHYVNKLWQSCGFSKHLIKENKLQIILQTFLQIVEWVVIG